MTTVIWCMGNIFFTAYFFPHHKKIPIAENCNNFVQINLEEINKKKIWFCCPTSWFLFSSDTNWQQLTRLVVATTTRWPGGWIVSLYGQGALQSRSAEYVQVSNAPLRWVNRVQRQQIKARPTAGDQRRAERIKVFYLRADADRQQHGEEHDGPELGHRELSQRLRVHHKHQTGTWNQQQQY